MGPDICFGALMTGRPGLRFFPLRSEILLRSSDMMRTHGPSEPVRDKIGLVREDQVERSALCIRGL